MFDPKKNYNVTSAWLLSLPRLERTEAFEAMMALDDLRAAQTLTTIQSLAVLVSAGKINPNLELEMICESQGFQLSEVVDSITREQWEQVPQELGGSAVA